MKYEIDREGSIVCGNRVVLSNPEQASARMIKEALQDAADKGFQEAVEKGCDSLRAMLDETRPMNVQHSTNHGRRVGP